MCEVAYLLSYLGDGGRKASHYMALPSSVRQNYRKTASAAGAKEIKSNKINNVKLPNIKIVAGEFVPRALRR